jgi:hypothetical protein
MRAWIKLTLDVEVDLPDGTLEEGLAAARGLMLEEIIPMRGRKFDLNDYNLEVISINKHDE